MNASGQQAKDIFVELIGHVAPEQWDDRLAQACGNDQGLLRRVQALLKAHREPDSFLEPVVDRDILVTIDQPLEKPGTQIGPYKLLQQIGEGGMGVVYMAEQHEPVKRRVALKIIKPGMDTRQVIARFEAERQALAVMEHPNIAKILDAGTTESGRPYFVMELVRGTPITEYCDENSLPIRERLALFASVCQAIQHAHTKGIIHRDIKPTNVLVTRQDGQPVVKVIDFGIAKAMGQQLTDKTLFTDFAQMIGTPLYMSPEQAELSSTDIDTRSDIYSLGVLLYELLTGSTPVSKQQLKAAAFDEIRRIIREDEPQKPSTRISTADAAPSIAAQRHTEPAKLTRLVRGELDWIVMKALEKDRSRRYETANGFAADVQRYLADEPVQACPPTSLYRFQKFARRNSGRLVAAAVLAVALLVAFTGIGWAVRDRAAREAEIIRERANREAELTREGEARRAKVSGQVELILTDVDQLENEQKWAEALAAARRAEAAVAGGEADAVTTQRVRERLKDLQFIERLEQIRMQKAAWVGRAFDYASAVRDYPRAFRDYGVDVEELAVEASIDRLTARPALAIPLAAALDEWVDARRVISEKDAGWQRLVAIARGIDPEPLRDRLRSSWGQPVSEEARDELRRLAESIDIRAQHPATLVSLARTLRRAQDSDSALRLLRDARYVYPGDFWLNFELGFALTQQKDDEGAIRFYTAAVAIRPNSTAALNDLAGALRRKERLDDAIANLTKAIEIDPKFAYGHNNLGDVLHAQGRLDDAIPYYRKAIALDPKFALARYNLGVALFQKRLFDEAIAEFGEVIRVEPDSADAWCYRGSGYAALKQFDKAIADYSKAIELKPDFALAWNNRGLAHKELQQCDKAIADLSKAIELKPDFAEAWNGRGIAYGILKQYDKAIADLSKAIELKRDYATAWYNRALAQYYLKRHEKAVADFSKAIELEPDHAGAWNNRGIAYKNLKRYDQAIADHSKAIDLKSDESAYWINRACAYRDSGQYDKAAADYVHALDQLCHEPEWDPPRKRLCRELAGCDEVFTRLTQLRPDDTDLWIGRGRHWALRRDWKRAAEAYAKVIAARPPHEDECFEYACVLLLADDKAGYEKFIKVLAERAAAGPDPSRGYVLARAAAVAPDPPAPADQVVRWAERSVGDKAPAWNLSALALAHYRAGQFDQAVRRARESNKVEWYPAAKAQNWLVLAMAHQRLGQEPEARQALGEARKLIDSLPLGELKDPLPLAVPDFLAVEVLSREALKPHGPEGK